MRLAVRWLWVAVGFVLPVMAQSPVQWKATAAPAVARPGEVVLLELTATIAPPYHIYAAARTQGDMIATSFSPAEGLEAMGGLREPQPSRHFDEGFQVEVLTHSGAVTFRQPIRIAAGTAAGKLSLAGVVAYQACTDTSCLRPAKEPVSASIEVVAGPIRAEYRVAPPETHYPVGSPGPEPGADGEASSAADRARAQGLGAFLLVAFLAGFAALLTPCVFPMVPITVSFFTKQAGHNARRRVGLAGA
ncbi:MAG: hypothetical protein HUU35_17220, partial [Armatimonadetes bacterium]|nr:hypothetical protein [Armatimonadota bacterium]